jgi:hypothetical protein
MWQIKTSSVWGIAPFMNRAGSSSASDISCKFFGGVLGQESVGYTIDFKEIIGMIFTICLYL